MGVRLYMNNLKEQLNGMDLSTQNKRKKNIKNCKIMQLFIHSPIYCVGFVSWRRKGQGTNRKVMKGFCEQLFSLYMETSKYKTIICL
jgi:hypothetical protein